MEITKDILEKLIWEDCDSRQKWMKVWTAIVGDALEKEEGPWELLYGLLFCPVGLPPPPDFSVQDLPLFRRPAPGDGA